MEKLIISAALIGGAPTKEQNPNVPYSPKEIAAEAIRSWEAGAAAVHIHVRDPETGKPAFDRDLFAETVDRIRSECDVLINLTTSAFRTWADEDGQARLMPLELKPDLCSLDVGTLNFRNGQVFKNPEDWVVAAAKAMQAAGVKPEMEVFDFGHIRQARNLVDQGFVDAPPWWQICLGVSWGAEGTIDILLEMVRRLPPGSVWSVLGVGPAQLTLTSHAMIMGGHVRVGFEDNLYLAKGVLAQSSAQFVERAVKQAKLINRETASPAEARKILGLPEK